MTVRIAKPAVNLREKLSELERPIGVNGAALMATNTPQEAFSLIGAGTRNRIINGDFEIWQRGTSVTYINGATIFYLADRWSGAPEYQNARHQRVSVTSPIAGMTARYALRASSSTSAEAGSGTRIATGQKIENLNCYDLAGKQITLSFYVKFSSATSSASSGTYGSFRYFIAYDGTTTDGSFNTTSPPTSFSNVYITEGSLPTTWTKYTLTATVPDGTNNISVRFQFDNLKNTASADTTYYDITNVQLEEGKVATPFEYRSYGQELALCQRYYERWTGSSNFVWYTGYGYNTAIYFYLSYKVPKRTNQPTAYFSTTSPSGLINAYGNTVTAANIGGIMNSSPVLVSSYSPDFSFYMNLTASTFTPYGTAVLWGITNNNWIAIDAEV